MAERRAGPDAQVLILGAGAAGLWCAAAAAAGGLDVLVVEKTARTGTKVLASGGTRCNLTTTLDGPGAGRLFGPKGERFLRHALRVLSPSSVRERFHRWGVPTEEADLEKIFPKSQRARDVRDALERAAREGGARIRTLAPALALESEGSLWRVRLEGGESLTAQATVLAVGGRSYPRTGTTGDGYPWLSQLGLEVVTPVPALVPLRSPAAWVRELAGLDWQGGELRHGALVPAPMARRRRPLVFSHQGLSGPGPMDLSEPVARAELEDRGLVLALDLFPDIAEGELQSRLGERAARRGNERVGQALLELGLGTVPRRLVSRALLEGGAPGIDAGQPEPRLCELSRLQRQGFVRALKGLSIPVHGTLGWDQAEVTAGGLALGEVDPGSARVRRVPGLYAIGELLDLQGPIGGLNFQAAFAMAQVAAEDLLRRYKQ